MAAKTLASEQQSTQPQDTEENLDQTVQEQNYLLYQYQEMSRLKDTSYHRLKELTILAQIQQVMVENSETLKQIAKAIEGLVLNEDDPSLKK